MPHFLRIVAIILATACFALFPVVPVIAQTATPLPPPVVAPTATNTAPLAGKSVADNVCLGVLSTEPAPVNPATVTVSSCQRSGDDSLGLLIRRIINLFTIVVGAVSVVMIIIGGFRYIISGGDSSGVSGAKNTILYAIVGLVIVLFAQIIIRFVLTNLTSGVK